MGLDRVCGEVGAELNLIALPRDWSPRGRVKAEQVRCEDGVIVGGIPERE